MCNLYVMYYTDALKGRSAFVCMGENVRELTAALPARSDQPLPPNPLLEEHAKHTHKEDMVSGCGLAAGVLGTVQLRKMWYWLCTEKCVWEWLVRNVNCCLGFSKTVVWVLLYVWEWLVGNVYLYYNSCVGRGE